MLGINSRSVASMLLNRKAVLDDGEIEVILVNSKKEPNFIKKTSIFFRILQVFAFGYNMCKNKRVYKKLKGSHFEIKVDNDFTWNYDGEEGKKGTITLDVIKQAITVIV